MTSNDDGTEDSFAAPTDCDSTDFYNNSPGTIPQRGCDRPILRYLNRYVVAPIAQVWFEIGLELIEAEREDELHLEMIVTEQPNDKRRATKMLQFWLEKKPDASWKDLIETLRISNIGLHTTAREIEGMLFPETINSMPLENEATCRSDVTEKEELIVGSSYEQQNSKHHIPQETTEKGLLSQSQMLVELNNVVMPQQMYTVDTTRSASSTCCSVGTKSVGTRSVTASQSMSATKGHLQPINSKKSTRICNAVSEYYRGQFVDRWKCKTDSSTINGLAALLVERDGEMKVVVLTAGTTKKGECSYSINNGSADECMWGHCDGHAVSLCYRFASFYLITEMHKYKKNRVMSILEIQQGGYELKEGIKLHFFTTNVPCGFMSNEDHYFLSWKLPFKGKPHCLKCSSIILINAYLGIQGPLSHLFSKPVNISSITMLKNENDAALKVARIKRLFESFDVQLQRTAEIPDSNYKFHIPHVEIADSKSRELFSECFKPYSRSNSHCDASPTIENQTEERKAAGVVPDVERNLGSHMIVFTLNNGIGADEFCRDMTLQLENASNGFANNIKKLQLNSLIEAQQRLIVALNISKALENMKRFMSKKMDERFTTHCKSTSEVDVKLKEIDKSRSIIEKTVSVQVNKLKDSVNTTMKSFDSDCDIPAVTSSLTSLRKTVGQIENYSRLMIENLSSLNKSVKKFENGTKSLLHELAGSAFNDISNLLEKSKSNTCDHQFYLELMGCDWARSLGAIRNEIQKGSHCVAHHTPTSLPISKDQRQQVPNEDRNHVIDNIEKHTEQETQNMTVPEEESQNRTVKPKEDSSPPGAVMGYGSSSLSLTKYGYQQQHCSLENDNAFDKEQHKNEMQEKETISPKECAVEHGDFIDFGECKGSYGSIHQACSSPSLPHDEEQQQSGQDWSNYGISGDHEGSRVKNIQPQNHTWEEDQNVIIGGMKAEGTIVPNFPIRCMREIEKRGLAVIDTYCLPGNVEQIQKLYERVDQGHYVDFADQDITVIAGALILF